MDTGVLQGRAKQTHMQGARCMGDEEFRCWCSEGENTEK